MPCVQGQELHRIFEWAVADRISVQWDHASRTDPILKEAQRREDSALLARTIHVSGCPECYINPPMAPARQAGEIPPPPTNQPSPGPH
jgi:hypothetical protein